MAALSLVINIPVSSAIAPTTCERFREAPSIDFTRGERYGTERTFR